MNGSSLQGSRRGRPKRRWLDKPIVRDDVKKEDTVGGGSIGPRSSHMEATNISSKTGELHKNFQLEPENSKFLLRQETFSSSSTFRRCRA